MPRFLVLSESSYRNVHSVAIHHWLVQHPVNYVQKYLGMKGLQQVAKKQHMVHPKNTQ